MAEQPEREMQVDEPDPLARLKRLLETLTRLGPTQKPLLGLERPSLDVQQPRREMEGQEPAPPRRWPQTQPAGLERPPLPPLPRQEPREMPGQSEFRGTPPRQMPGQPTVIAPAAPARAAEGVNKDGNEKLVKALDELTRELKKQKDKAAEPQQPGPQSDGSFVPSFGKTAAQAAIPSPAQNLQRDMLRRTQADRARRPR